MKYSDLPAKFPIPFAKNAGGSYIWAIPEASQIGITDGRASLYDGFVPLNFIPVGAGGVPPFGKDFNGLLNQMSAWNRWQCAGGTVKWDSAFATSTAGGYPAGALVASATTSGKFWYSTVDDNITNPDTGGAGWIAFYIQVGQRINLTGNTTYYVNSSTGNDTTGDGSSGAPWATAQHAWDYVNSNIDMRGYTITVNCTGGAVGTVTALSQLTGGIDETSFTFVGNAGSPSSVPIAGVSSCFFATGGAKYSVNGFKLTCSNGTSILAGQFGRIAYQNIEFGAAQNAHVSASNGGTVVFNGNCTCTGGAQNHFYATIGGQITSAAGNVTLTITGTQAFTVAFADAFINGLIYMPSTNVSFVGAATGVRYLSNGLGNVYTNGGGANFFPGNSAGSTSNGGVYI